MRTLGFLGLWLVSGAAGAHQAEPVTQAAPGAEAVPDANDDIARGLFQAGKAAYESGNYSDALGTAPRKSVISEERSVP